MVYNIFLTENQGFNNFLGYIHIDKHIYTHTVYIFIYICNVKKQVIDLLKEKPMIS